MRALCEKVKLPGLGVAIGVNLAHAFCGLFGPNRQYTAFSTGMNQTARLQSLGGFRETLVMESVREALGRAQEPCVQGAAVRSADGDAGEERGASRCATTSCAVSRGSGLPSGLEARAA